MEEEFDLLWVNSHHLVSYKFPGHRVTAKFFFVVRTIVTTLAMTTSESSCWDEDEYEPETIGELTES